LNTKAENLPKRFRKIVKLSTFSDLGGKMKFLGHNFGSRHARRSSKGSIDAGDHPVFKKRLSQNFDP